MTIKQRDDQFRPFSVDALPEPIRGFVVAGAKAIGCDESYLALPLLTALAAAIGSTRRILLKRGWAAPSIIWSAIVGESGTSKTPAFKAVMRYARDRQHKAFEENEATKKRYDEEVAYYNKALRSWTNNKKVDGPPPAKPDPPPQTRYIVSDTTIEGLWPLLLANPRGLLLARDELAGWIGSFDRYASGKGDSAHWLSIHNGESITVDRKTEPRTIYVPQAYVSITGGIQPGILHKALGQEHRESGLSARLLLSCPPRKPKRWTEAEIPHSIEAEMSSLSGRLYGLRDTVDDEGKRCAAVLGLTHNAKKAWTGYYDRHNDEQVELSGDLSAAYSKLEEYAARLALVLHCCDADVVALESADAVGVASMNAGIELAEWHKAEVRRVYSLLAESDEDRDRRNLAEWISNKGEPVTAREVQQGHRQFKTRDEAEAALTDLYKHGWGQWESSPSGKPGRPTWRFTVHKASTVDANTLIPEENIKTVDGYTVDVDTVDGQQLQPSDDDWGEV